MTASMRPIALTCSAMLQVSEALRRSPITNACCAILEVRKRRKAVGGTDVKDHLVALVDQRDSCGPAKAVGASCNEDACH